MAYVYKHTNKINGKVYIGWATDYKTRWSKGYTKGTYIRKAIDKYGWDNFEHEILFADISPEEAKKKEIELIAQYKANDSRYGYNLTKGGEGTLGHVLSDEAKARMIATRYKNNSPEYLFEISSRGGRASKGNTGHKHTEEAKEKMRKAKLGYKPAPITEEERERRRQFMTGRKMSLESRKKMSMAKIGSIPWNKGRELTPEEKQQLREKRRGAKNRRLLTYNGKTQCVAEWAQELNLPETTIWTRLAKGVSVDEALCTKRNYGKGKK